MSQVLTTLAAEELIFTLTDIHSGNVEVQIVYRLHKLCWERYAVLTACESFKVLKHLKRKLLDLHLLICGNFLSKHAMQDGDVCFDKGDPKAFK